MADTELEGLGFVDARDVVRSNNGTLPLSTRGGYDDVAGLRAALTTANGAYFTASRLNTMTKNDMVYAIRLSNDAGSVR